ncbi:MAG: glutamine--fructose-6-phosphate transaminase (isomerizing) [Zetaproteobacteria bacterium]|nr:MAG: glutamine--fructose-6-phosphate transaminase (isomerizing) [Zetaproteobacteria bacterium]
MCGIIGALGTHAVQDALLGALQRMEYRGYDSAGICTLDVDRFHQVKAPGKLKALREKLREHGAPGRIGIGHTRWATHGEPSVDNAHPHLSEQVAIVHNGIIENHHRLRKQLRERGCIFTSQTDTEVLPHLLQHKLAERDGNILAAWRAMLGELEGAYAIAAIVRGWPEALWFARKGSPLLLGRGPEGVYVASDALALAGLADSVMYVEEGEWGCLGAAGVELYDLNGHAVQRDWEPLPMTAHSAGKGGFSHYMLKEIHEQPAVLRRILRAYAHDGTIRFDKARFLHEQPLPERIVMVACGTSYHAALTARYWIERYLQVPVEVDIASEYRYRNPVIGANTLLVTLSQSGETADTLEVLRMFKRQTPDNPTLALCNVASSSLARESDGLIELFAGPEIGVASTKAYMAQLAVLALFTLMLSKRAGALSGEDVSRHVRGLERVVHGMEAQLADTADIDRATRLFADVHGALYLGRGPCFPMALEGALKLKEISYLHAEGYAAGEMKHGPIALIDSTLPVIVIAPHEYQLDKVVSNLHEVQARGARVILIVDTPDADWAREAEARITIPQGDYFSTPLLVCIPLQMLAYKVACMFGTDVDQPRNLAKSVTVE